MKNFTRVHCKDGIYDTLRLIDDSGYFLEVMDIFVASLIRRGEAQATVTRYADAVAQFLDYLTEAGVFGHPSSRYEILMAVDCYLPARVASESEPSNEALAPYVEIVRTLQHKRLKRSSAKNAASAINRFITLSDYWAKLDRQMAEWVSNGSPLCLAPADLFLKLDRRERSAAEVKNIMQKSFLAGVSRWKSNRIEAPHILVPRSKEQEPSRDLPAEWVIPLLNAASSYRDRAIWAIIAGGGLRPSEANLLTWEAIDVENREVFVYDPKSLRFADQLPSHYRRRFKGRKYSETYIIPQLRDIFFESLEGYLRCEYRPTYANELIFQDIRPTVKVKPYVLVSDSKRVQAFHDAAIRAKLPRRPDGKRYTPHSLRHFYGVFMLNYIPVEGGYGLRLSEVQTLMGHESITTTKHYAREDRIILEAKLRSLDAAVLGQTDEERNICAWIAKRHAEVADHMRQLVVTKPVE